MLRIFKYIPLRVEAVGRITRGRDPPYGSLARSIAQLEVGLLVAFD